MCLPFSVTQSQWNLDLFTGDSDPEARQFLTVSHGEWGWHFQGLSLFFFSQVLCMIGLVTPCFLCTLNLQYRCHLQYHNLGTLAYLHLLETFMGTHHRCCPVRILWLSDRKLWKSAVQWLFLQRYKNQIYFVFRFLGFSLLNQPLTYPVHSHYQLCSQEWCWTSGIPILLESERHQGHLADTHVLWYRMEKYSFKKVPDALCLKHRESLLGDFERDFPLQIMGREWAWESGWGPLKGDVLLFLSFHLTTCPVHPRLSLV